MERGAEESARDHTVSIFSTWGDRGHSIPLSPEAPLRALMGWDGILLWDHAVDVVDMAREYALCARAESCGQCFPCRLGTLEIAEILDRISAGRGHLRFDVAGRGPCGPPQLHVDRASP
jgi:hypothetical protein